MKGEIEVAHNRGYNERMEYKNYDRNKHKNNKERFYKFVLSEKRNAMKIEKWKEELKEMKLEMEV